MSAQKAVMTQDNLYLFIQNGNYASPTYGNLAATIVMNSGVFTVDGSVTFNGVVMSNGTGTFIAKGSTTLNAQYYTPNADVQLVSGDYFQRNGRSKQPGCFRSWQNSITERDMFHCRPHFSDLLRLTLR